MRVEAPKPRRESPRSARAARPGVEPVGTTGGSPDDARQRERLGADRTRVRWLPRGRRVPPAQQSRSRPERERPAFRGSPPLPSPAARSRSRATRSRAPARIAARGAGCPLLEAVVAGDPLEAVGCGEAYGETARARPTASASPGRQTRCREAFSGLPPESWSARRPRRPGGHDGDQVGAGREHGADRRDRDHGLADADQGVDAQHRRQHRVQRHGPRRASSTEVAVAPAITDSHAPAATMPSNSGGGLGSTAPRLRHQPAHQRAPITPMFRMFAPSAEMPPSANRSAWG